MKIFAGTRPLSAMGKLCSLRFLRSELARQSQSTFDAFVRTPCTEWRSQELKRPNLTKDEKDLLTRSPCNQGYRKYALFLTNNCLRLDMALEIFDRRMQGLLDPDTFMWRGTAKMLMGRRDAIVDLEYSLNMFPQNEFAQLIRISYLIRERLQLGECKDKLEKIIGNDSKSQHALLLRAILAWTTGADYRTTAELFNNVLDINCSNEYAWAGLAIIHFHNNQKTLAKKCAEQALEVNSTNFCAAAIKHSLGAFKHSRVPRNPWDDRERDRDVTLLSLLSDPLWCNKIKRVKPI